MMYSRKKRLFLILAAVIGVLCCAACVYFGSLSEQISTVPLQVKYGRSEIYSHTDIDAAVAAIQRDFASMQGCRLYSLQYAGDAISQKELETYNRNCQQEETSTDCIVMESVFRSPIRGGGAWNANELYTWNWIVVKDREGNWIVVNKGYA